MKKSPLIVASLILVLLGVSVRAADVSGVWPLRLTTNDGESAAFASVTLKKVWRGVVAATAVQESQAQFW